MSLIKKCCNSTDDILFDSKLQIFTVPVGGSGEQHKREPIENCKHCGARIELSEEVKRMHLKLTGEML